MSVTAPNAASAILTTEDDMYIVLPASGTATEINPGDYVSFSGQYIHATHTGFAWTKASGVGIALTRNPAYDWAGRPVVNSAVVVATRGTFRVSAHFSGQPLLGANAFPAQTGSAVNAASGQTGLGAVWQTAIPVNVSGATAVAPSRGVGQVIGWTNSGPAGTGQMDIRVWPRNSDYY